MPIEISTAAELGDAIRRARKAQNLRVEDVALAAGTGLRFVGELERGKPTVRMDATLRVLQALGLRVVLTGATPDADA